MRRFTLPAMAMLALLLVITARSAAAQEQPPELVGTWVASLEVDEERLKGLLGDSSATPEAIEAFKAKVKGYQIRLVLNADGTSQMESGSAGSKKTVKSTWSVQSKTKNIYVVQGKSADGNEEVLRFKMTEENSFEMESDKLQNSPFVLPVFIRQ